MSELAKLLSSGDVLHKRLKFGCPEPAKLRRAVELLPGNPGSCLTQEMTADLQARVHRLVQIGATERLSRRDLREACKVFVHPPTPLIGDEQTAESLFTLAKTRCQRSAVLALIASYVDGFRKDELFAVFAAELRKLVAQWKGKPIAPWAELDRAMGFFNPEIAPEKIAAAVLGGDRTIPVTLAAFGIDTELRRKGSLAEAAFVSATRILAQMRGLAAIPRQERVIEWMRAPRGEQMYPGAFPEAAKALLVPWASEDPPAHHRARLIEELRQLGGGDPRTKPAAWRAVKEHAPQAYSVLMRWLTRASVFQFFDIVDQSLASDPQGRRMWAYRRSFWTSYLLGQDGAPQIEEAWVAFGADGDWLAKKAARENSEAGLSAFGRQEDKTASHAALIMRIGDLIIVDWSHNAKCNFWRRGDKGVPYLYREHYARGTLYSAPEQHSHTAPSNFSWQRKFAEIIEERSFYKERKSWRLKHG